MSITTTSEKSGQNYLGDTKTGSCRQSTIWDVLCTGCGAADGGENAFGLNCPELRAPMKGLDSRSVNTAAARLYRHQSLADGVFSEVDYHHV